MDSTNQLSGGGGASEPSSAALAQPSSVATTLFAYLERDLPALLGVPADKIAAARKEMLQGTDWSRISRQFRWSPDGLKKLAAAFGSPAVASDVKNPPRTAPDEKPAPTAKPGAVATLTVINLNIPNKSLVLCQTDSGASAKVIINTAWRPRFRHGMKIQATLGAGGVWRTRCPRFIGKF